jgi:hypothetical protein
MKSALVVTMALIGMLALPAPPHAQAQAPNPSLIPGPGPGPSLVFPLNQPVTFRYTDAQGTGSITFVDLGTDPLTTFDRLQVTVAQNGFSYTGAGIAAPLPGAPPPLTNLVSFTVVGLYGATYFFEGKMGLGVEYQGSGTYFPVNNPTQTATWGLLFAPGVPTPGPPPPVPPPPALSLGVDRGCGRVYPLGATMVITYSAPTNDTLTLTDQRLDGTRVLLTNQPVIAGQTYSYNTYVDFVAGPRTLILTDPAGAQATCSFTGQ